MKRIPRNITQRAWKYVDMFPSFVSIVKTGANRIPFSTLKLSEDDGYEEGYDIQKIVFSHNFTEQVAIMYLEDKGITDYTLAHTPDGRLCVESDGEFEDIKKISLDNLDVYVGKTPTATKQIKTKIISEEPIMQLDDENVAEEVITTGAPEDTLNEDVSAGSVALDDDTAAEEDKVVEDTATEVVELEDSADTKELPDVDSIKDEPATESVELASNEYIESLKQNAPYAAVDSFIYALRYRLTDILETCPADLDTMVMNEVNSFAVAVLSQFKAVTAIPDEDGNEEPVMLEDKEEVVIKTDIDDLIVKLTDIIDQKLNSFAENNKQEVDKEVVMLQNSKADVSAFDVSEPMSETKPQVKPISTTTKNLFGLRN